MEVQTAGATARRASPRTMRCSLSRASGTAPAQLPQNPTLLLRRQLSRNPQRKWIFSASTGRASAAHLLHLSPRPLQPRPLTYSGTCLVGRPSQPVGSHLPSRHHIKWPQTLPRHAPPLHRQVRYPKTTCDTQMVDKKKKPL